MRALWQSQSFRLPTRRRAWVALFGATAALGMAGCGGEESGAMTADLERDLQMAVNAQRPRTGIVSALEGGRPGSPSGDQRGRREAVATRRQAPRPAPQAEEQEVAVAPVVDEAPAPAMVVAEQVEPTPAPVPEPETRAPAPVGISYPTDGGPSAGSASDEGEGRRGTEGMGRGRGGGVIIRGGGAGEDHCEEHDRRRGGHATGWHAGHGHGRCDWRRDRWSHWRHDRRQHAPWTVPEVLIGGLPGEGQGLLCLASCGRGGLGFPHDDP